MPNSTKSTCSAPSNARVAIVSYILNLSTYIVSFHRPPGASEAFVVQRMLVMLLCPLSSSYTSMYFLITYLARIASGEISISQILRTLIKIELPKTFQDAVSAGAIAILIPSRFHEVAISDYWCRAEFGTIAFKMDLEELDQGSSLRPSVFLVKTQHRIRGFAAKQSLYPSSNLLPQVISCVQLIYSVWTYVEAYKGSMNDDGLSSPYLSMLPYMLMSFINLVANMFIPTYSNIVVLLPAGNAGYKTWSEWEQHPYFAAGALRPADAASEHIEAGASSQQAHHSSGSVLPQIGTQQDSGQQTLAAAQGSTAVSTSAPTPTSTNVSRQPQNAADRIHNPPAPKPTPATTGEPQIARTPEHVDSQTNTPPDSQVTDVPLEQHLNATTEANLATNTDSLRQHHTNPSHTLIHEPEGEVIKPEARPLYTYLSSAYPDIDFENATFALIRRRFHPYLWTVASFIQENNVLFLIPIVLSILLAHGPFFVHTWHTDEIWVLLWMFGGAIVEAGDDFIMAYSEVWRRWRRNLKERTTIEYGGFDTNLPGIVKRILQIIFFAGGLAVVLRQVYVRACLGVDV